MTDKNDPNKLDDEVQKAKDGQKQPDGPAVKRDDSADKRIGQEEQTGKKKT